MLSQIQQALEGHSWQGQIVYLDTVNSTNTYAKQLACQGAQEGTVVLADRQTGGRGRLGRSFSSPAGMGIYLSLILRPNCPPKEIMHLTCAAGVAAVRALDDPRIGIKWTNDLVLSKRKLGGILTELSVDPKTGLVEWVVIGIGINCCQNNQDFPPEIRDIACSLGMVPQQIPCLIARLIRALFTMRQQLLTDKPALLAEFSDRCVTLGQQICVVRADTVRHGRAIAVDGDGGLVVEYTDGSRQVVTSGEVSIRGMYGYV